MWRRLVLRTRLRTHVNPHCVITYTKSIRRFCVASFSKPNNNHAVVSTFDMFSIGIGPSSSHTVGPMRASKKFVDRLQETSKLSTVHSIFCELYGSLACTGIGHGTDYAIIMGLEGESPEHIDPTGIHKRIRAIGQNKKINLRKEHEITFIPIDNLIWHTQEFLPYHSNGMKLIAKDKKDEIILEKEYYSIGGGFVVDGDPNKHNAYRFIEEENPDLQLYDDHPPLIFENAEEMFRLGRAHDMKISDIVRKNERHWRSDDEITEQLMRIWNVMNDSITNGITNKGLLQTTTKRRAAGMHERLMEAKDDTEQSLNSIIGEHQNDWLYCWAMAVNEENAVGGRVVTAPTNGAAGVIPSVIKYYQTFHRNPSDDGICRMLMTASAIGCLYKRGASLSAAEVGCQGEIGVASSMAAAALTEAMGGTIDQVGNAAEIAMEHSLGLTCDPIGGFVEIPCIERNAIGAVKAVAASRMALYGDGKYYVSLDAVIKTMKDTGDDMKSKYKETSLGGLAINVPVC